MINKTPSSKMKKNFDMSLKFGANFVHKKRKFSQKKNENYRKKYIKDGLIKKKFLIKTSCPVCKLYNKQILFIKDGGTYKKCKNCEMIYLDPVFKDDELNNYYKTTMMHNPKYPKMKEIFTIECLVQDFPY